MADETVPPVSPGPADRVIACSSPVFLITAPRQLPPGYDPFAVPMVRVSRGYTMPVVGGALLRRD